MQHNVSVFTPFVCMLIDDVVKNNPIIILFNHKGIAII